MGPADELGATDASDQGGEKFARIRDEANKLKAQAADRARTAAQSGKEKATTTLEGLVQTLHETASRLETQTGPTAAQYAHRAADALDSLATTLRHKDVDQLLDDARNLVRRNPGVAIGAAVAVGFVMSRFLKATSPARGNRGMERRAAYPSAEGVATTDRAGGAGAGYNA